MSLRETTGKISHFFNWLTQEPRRHWTLRELVPIVTDGHVNPAPPRPINRFARGVERLATVAGLGAGIYFGIVMSSLAPVLIIPVAAQVAAWFTGAISTIVLEKMADTADRLHGWAINRDIRNEKKNKPVGVKPGTDAKKQAQKKDMHITPIVGGSPGHGKTR